MNDKVSILFAAGLLACGLQALSAPPVVVHAATPQAVPRTVIRSMPLEKASITKDSEGLPPPRICYLGNDCLTVDSHPFEFCQLSGKSCGDKLAEVLQVQQPAVVLKPGKSR